jgi:glyoxylase-like metal-dependent hydrolase (beta-lactamase superfamily II)
MKTHKLGYVRTACAVLTICAAIATLTSTLSGQTPVALVPLERPAPPAVVAGLDILKVQGQVFMIAGAGANIVVQAGDEGVLVVDTGAAGQSAKVLEAIDKLSPKRLRFMINTSADADRTGNNDAVVKSVGLFGPNRPATVVGGGGNNPGGANAGALTVAHENALNRMLSAGLSGDALPISTFFGAHKDFFSNGESVQLFYQPAAHTDGDILVVFRRSDVVATGDIFVPNRYPVIDTAKGGTVQGEIDALNNILDITVPERNQMGGTRVIPGHGRISNEAEIVDYRDMVTIVRDRVQDMIKKGMTLAQIKAAKPTLEYDGYYGAPTGPASPDGFLEAVYRTLGGK